jgi:hypothetical protein
MGCVILDPGFDNIVLYSAEFIWWMPRCITVSYTGANSGPSVLLCNTTTRLLKFFPGIFRTFTNSHGLAWASRFLTKGGGGTLISHMRKLGRRPRGYSAMRRLLLANDNMRIDLSKIDAKALSEAIREFGRLGRTRFLKKWAFSRSSKFYLLHQQHLFDVKSLVGASYFHATGRRLTNDRFAGGRQTVAAIAKVIAAQADYRASVVFEDTLGELSNLADDFDRLPQMYSDIGRLGFSKWIKLEEYKNLHTGKLPGVYVIAKSASKPLEMRIDDRRVLYIGETVSQTLGKRLHQFRRALDGKGGHSGGDTLGPKYRHNRLWLSIRSFPLRADMSVEFTPAFRSSQIQLLERLLLYAYACAHGKYPVGNVSR